MSVQLVQYEKKVGKIRNSGNPNKQVSLPYIALLLSSIFQFSKLNLAKRSKESRINGM